MSLPQVTISVLIPTWRRPLELARCLRAVCAQSFQAKQIVVTVRRDDIETLHALERLLQSGDAPNGLEVVVVEPMPLVAAMTAGLAQTNGTLVALTDDDAEPRLDWLERIVEHFRDPTVGGVGGRDWQLAERWDEPKVGIVSWYGRTIGNHHLGAGPARGVELLKGVNCCFRGDELRRMGFDRRLRGKGNVSHWEMSLCLAFRQAGWQLLYDPLIAVDHNMALRHDGDINARGGFAVDSFIDSVHNETLALLGYLSPIRRAAFLAWAAALGTGESPGLAQLLRLELKGRPQSLARWRATIVGRCAGMRSYLAISGNQTKRDMDAYKLAPTLEANSK
jgi:glycosyltransferase involved in cell wall biosynthesis